MKYDPPSALQERDLTGAVHDFYRAIRNKLLGVFCLVRSSYSGATISSKAISIRMLCTS